MGGDGELDVLIAIDDILARQLSWEEFVRLHGWEPVQLFGQDTYPGAIELFVFTIIGPTGQHYQVIASHVQNRVVVCAVARRFTPLT